MNLAANSPPVPRFEIDRNALTKPVAVRGTPIFCTFSSMMPEVRTFSPRSTGGTIKTENSAFKPIQSPILNEQSESLDTKLFGDLSHLGAIIILLLKIWKTRSCTGVSGKTQILFLIVFTTRYLDLFTNFVSVYNTSMKIIYLALIYTTVFFIYRKFRATYNSVDDTFRVEFILIPTFALAVLENHKSEFMEILWTFSIYLESLAILPQLFMITNTGSAETITYHYLFALGIYRALYIINWIYRYYTEGLYDMITIVAGCVQTVFFLDFFYLYATRVLKGKDVILPV